MTPEQLKQFNDLLQRVSSLEEENSKLRSSTTIPFEIDVAFRDRLSRILGLSTSSKTANSENQAVDEDGTATYSVLQPPDGFLQVNINSITYYLPYYL